MKMCGQVFGRGSLKYVLTNSMPAGPAVAEEVNKYAELYDGLSTLMAEYDLEPSVEQYGVAVGAVVRYQLGQKKQIWIQPAGSGKSRVLVLVGLLMQKVNKKFKSIYVYYSHEVLRQTDDRIWTRIAATSAVPFERRIMPDLTGVGPSSLILVDEADYMLFDLAVVFKATQTVIGLTATCTDLSKEAYQQYIRQFQYDIIQSGIKPGTKRAAAEHLVNITAADFFSTPGGRMPQLVFLHAEMVEEYNALAVNMGNTVVVNCSDIDVVRHLQPAYTYLVTEEVLMRGVDYHSDNDEGIRLLIAAPMTSQRALE